MDDGGWQPIQEWSSSGPESSSGAKLLAEHFYGNGIDELLATARDTTNNGVRETFYFHQDEQGSVRVATNQAGQVVERYDYGDYGTPRILDPNGVTSRPASTISNAHLYTGRLWVSEIGLYDYRHRWLDPRLGRFVSRDPVGYIAR